MAQQHDHPGSLVPQETNFDNADTPGLAQPYSQSEIEDLLYGEDRSVAGRLARLQEMRDEIAARASGDITGHDPTAMLSELDRALEELRGDTANIDETGDAGAIMMLDPADHLDALSPDDIEAREAIIGEDEFYDHEEDGPADDDHVWHGSDEFKPDLN